MVPVHPGEGTPSMLGDMDVPPFWPPFFDILGIELDLYGVLFLIHWHQNDRLGVLKLPILTEFDFLSPNSIFLSIFLGPIFSGQRHTPIGFRTEYPPLPPFKNSQQDLKKSHST